MHTLTLARYRQKQIISCWRMLACVDKGFVHLWGNLGKAIHFVKKKWKGELHCLFLQQTKQTIFQSLSFVLFIWDVIWENVFWWQSYCQVHFCLHQGTFQKEEVLPLRLKNSREYFPERAKCLGILPSSSMMCAMWSMEERKKDTGMGEAGKGWDKRRGKKQELVLKI